MSLFTQDTMLSAESDGELARTGDIVELQDFQSQFVSIRDSFGGQAMFADVTKAAPEDDDATLDLFDEEQDDLGFDGDRLTVEDDAAEDDAAGDVTDNALDLLERDLAEDDATRPVTQDQREAVCAELVEDPTFCERRFPDLLTTSEPSAVAFVAPPDRERFERSLQTAIDRLPSGTARQLDIPDLSTMTVDELVVTLDRVIQARAEQEGLDVGSESQEGGFPWLAVAGIAGGALLLAFLGGDDDEGRGVSGLSGAEPTPPSRGLRVGFLGGVSGLAAYAASELTGVGFLGSLGGGAVGALAHNGLVAADEFESDPFRLGIYGAAAGLSAKGLSEAFEEAEGIPSLVSRVVGHALGGAVGALATDGLAPREFRLKEGS